MTGSPPPPSPPPLLLLLVAGLCRVLGASALRCFYSECSDGNPLPCFGTEVVHSSIDCAAAPAVSTYGVGRTARGNPYDGCQRIRKQASEALSRSLGWPEEGEVTFRCASMLESEQDDYHCGECNEDGSGCSNEYVGEGFNTPNNPSVGATPASGPGLLLRFRWHHLLPWPVQPGITSTWWCCTGSDCNVSRR